MTDIPSSNQQWEHRVTTVETRLDGHIKHCDDREDRHKDDIKSVKRWCAYAIMAQVPTMLGVLGLFFK